MTNSENSITPSPAPLVSNAPVSAPLFQKAAKASWQLPILICVLLILGSPLGPQIRLGIEMACLLIMVSGLCAGVFALFGIRKHGTKGILIPALLGFVINGVLLMIFASNFIAARAKAQQDRQAAAAAGHRLLENKTAELP